MDPLVEEARQVVSNLLGKMFAEKATREFCLSFSDPTSGLLAAAVEGHPGLLPIQRIVIEFAPLSDSISSAYIAIDSLRETKAWTGFERAARKAISIAPGQDLFLRPAHLLRQAKITALSNDLFKTAAPVRNEIERLAAGFPPAHPETAWPQFPPSVTEVCWLNRSLKTCVNPRTLAEIAADKNIERIDMVRPLRSEINVTGVTVGAVKFRKKFKRSGKGVIVAIIDEEIPLKHPALAPRVIQKANFSREAWGRPGTHGAALAGIIGSSDDEFTGIAPEALIYNYKVQATNRIVFGDDIDGVRGLEQALQDGADIANCSWGTGRAGDGTSREARACNEAWKCGLVVVKSAGNDGPGASTLTTPADADGVIVVGATDRQGRVVQDYSSRGPAGTRARPHLVAPGGTNGEGIQSCELGGGFQPCAPGTSFAAAHVSGVLALILEGEPSITPDELRAKLVGLCTSLGGADVNTH